MILKKIIPSLLAITIVAALCIAANIMRWEYTGENRRRIGTQKDWAELRKEYERGERVVVPLSSEESSQISR